MISKKIEDNEKPENTMIKVQFNTDKTINGDERHQSHFTSRIEEALKRFESHITRIEVHLSNENGKAQGFHGKQCLLEARIEGRQPIVVSCQAGAVELAMSGALDKLQSALETIMGRIQNH
ncbi:MAG: ribosome-associated translation inhibitor RaiA [Cyclobacteriaceae bacterium]|jgi:ribosome-associated translation inhibitor RaiA